VMGCGYSVPCITTVLQTNATTHYNASVRAKLCRIEVSQTLISYTGCSFQTVYIVNMLFVLCRATQFSEMIKECDDIVFPKVSMFSSYTVSITSPSPFSAV